MTRKPPVNPDGTLARLHGEFVSAGARNSQHGVPLRAAPDSSAILSFLDELGHLAAELWAEGRLQNFPTKKETPDDDD